LLSALVALPALAEDAMPNYELSVSFDLQKNLVRGNAVITLPDNGEWVVSTEGLDVTKVVVAGIPLDPAMTNEAGGMIVKTGGIIEIGYEKAFSTDNTVDNPENVGVVGSVVSDEGISLTGGWYPQIEGLANFHLTATVPEGFMAVSEADVITGAETDSGTMFTFDSPHPSAGMTLAAGRYTVSSDREDDTDIYAYFFDEDKALAREYLDYTKGYIKMYNEMFGAYPYKRFSVVENFLPTGFSMPTYTLLGRDVVRLPFIVKTSLGHEVLHQWFGNSVYGDLSGGNWLEGITNYMADQLYEEREGRGADYRKKILADYQSYVKTDKEITLQEFTGRVDPATKAVGYGKGAMVFHMLRKRAGDDVFMATLKDFVEKYRFKEASWADIRAEFERAMGVDLKGFFDQWLTRKGVPDFDLYDPHVIYLDGKPNVRFTLKQNGEPYDLRLKVRVSSDKGEFVKVIELNKKEQDFDLVLDGTPREMVIDPDYDVMRVLWEDEFAPTISRLLGDEKRVLVIPNDGVDDYLQLTKLLRGKDFNVMLDDEVEDADLSSSSVLLLGADGPVHRRLFAKSPVKDPGEGFEITVMKNPLNPDKVVAIAVASSREEVEAAARKIFHYGKYSHLKFIGGRNVEKDIAKSDMGVKVRLEHKVTGIKPSEAIPLDDIVKDVMDKDIIYVGESHTSYEDHRVQLDVIRTLSEEGHDLAIGMEMFQRPFQNAVDDYIEGRTTEREFLKASEYFSRWNFDYSLYREILQYARAHHIPVVALNLDKDIIKKVSTGGLDALSDEEKGKIPPDMDMSDMKYRRSLQEVFGFHANAPKRQFENFYQSQILWDETMAHSVADYMKEHPGRQMVVLAGVGHVAWGRGIPQRARRLNGKDYAILINADIETVEKGIADYVLFPERLAAPEMPKLGVMISKKEEGVLVEDVVKGSVALSAGIKKGDVIVSVDGVQVDDVGDVKVGLFDHKAGDVVEIKVKRKRFLGRMKEHTIPVTLK